MEIENNDTEITAENNMEDNSESVQASGEPATDVVPVEELLPALRGALAENNVQLEEEMTVTMAETISESMPEVVEHPLMTTDFNDYTVTEGLLLVIALVLVINFFLTIIRRWF